MQSSRDSSIWRSLAVAFGDGVAFGVGIKLAQGPNRPAATAPAAAPAAAPALDSVTDRLQELEHRLASIENAPPPVIPAASAPAPFDQKVLEAIVNALDARLKEQAGAVERRLTELEAKLAIELKGLEQKDNAIVHGVQKRLEEAHGQYNEHLTAIRDAVAEDMDILYGQVAKTREEAVETARQAVSAATAEAFGASLDARIAAAVTSLVAAQIASRVEAAEDRMRGYVRESAADAVERAAQASITETGKLAGEMASIRTAMEKKDRDIAELRQRIADSDQTVLDLILAMGQMCRQVAERISTPSGSTATEAARPPAPPTEPPADAAPPSAPAGDSPADPSEPPRVEAFAMEPEPLAVAVAAPNGVNGHTTIEPLPPAPADETAPGYQRPSRLWRIPLVSSFLILAAGSLHLLR